MVYTEEAHTSLQTSLVWLSGWKSHKLELAMDISSVSWVWLSEGHHKLGSLSSVVLLYFRFHKNHEVKGSGKQNKEHEKENRKGIWRMTLTLSKDLVWFSWQVFSCSLDQLKLPLFLFLPSHSTWQDFNTEIQSWCHKFVALASVSLDEGRWQAIVNLLLEPIDLADEVLQLLWKQVWCVSHTSGIRTYKKFFPSPKIICPVEMWLKKITKGNSMSSFCFCQRCSSQSRLHITEQSSTSNSESHSLSFPITSSSQCSINFTLETKIPKDFTIIFKGKKCLERGSQECQGMRYQVGRYARIHHHLFL